ncbi:hypothetical protein BJP36_41075 [Moorena producens JHB]|uniref:Uncharacterized protein n=1 Tax=Moorena producens (strain JHB) TaxID=1454205 RepID=A0A9Q9SSD2_MOOP1|nr:hypothetical protein [Moorena producens]WAN68760.1 hypothetical protein BJP36_41075 [Moorena producens JHB]
MYLVGSRKERKGKKEKVKNYFYLYSLDSGSTIKAMHRYSRFPIPDSQFPIPDSQFPIPNSRFPIPVPLLGGVRGGFRFPIPNSRFPIPDSQFPISSRASKHLI